MFQGNLVIWLLAERWTFWAWRLWWKKLKYQFCFPWLVSRQLGCLFSDICERLSLLYFAEENKPSLLRPQLCLNGKNYLCLKCWNVQFTLSSIMNSIVNTLWKEILCCFVLGYRAWLWSITWGWWSYKYTETGTHTTTHMDRLSG